MTQAIRVCHESDQEWLVERTRGLGGSDAPQVLGVSPFGGPASVAAVKLGYHVGDVESELHEWGHYVEEPLIRRFYDETGIAGNRSGFLYRSLDPSTPWLQATVDGEIEGDPKAGIQCKFALFSADSWDEGVPEYVAAQVQHEMAVTGWERVYVLVLLGGYKFRWAAVERDPVFIDDVLLPTEAEFWRKLQANERIEPKGAPDREWEALKARFPVPSPGLTRSLAGPEWVEVVHRWRHHADAKSQHEKAAKELRNSLVSAIGEAEFGLLDDGTRLSLKLTERKEFTTAASSFRTLRIVGGKS